MQLKIFTRKECHIFKFKGFPGGSVGKESTCMWETWVLSLGWEDPLEEDMAPTPVFLPGKSPCTEEPLWAKVHGVTKSRPRLSDQAQVWIQLASKKKNFFS